jgi:Fe-S cluster biogenesis protein NfuA/nitrite reductase/ring-hydroxylating ferredoxin subunit
MSATVTSETTEALLNRVQDLQAELDSCEDGPAQALAEELVGAVVAMYGAGLERILDLLLDGAPDDGALAQALAEDPHIATLLLIHDLHPVPLGDRVSSALEQVRPYMESHGGNVELISLEDGVARIKLSGSCSDCAASTVTLELAVKQALDELAPDLEGLEVEGVAPQAEGLALPMAPAASGTAGIELPIVISEPLKAPLAPAWFEVDRLDMLPAGRVVAAAVAGADLLVANVDGTLLAYRDSCPSCAGPLHDGVLEAGALACPGCSRRFFLPRAGRSLDDERIQLEPVPLLREQGHVKVAVPA